VVCTSGRYISAAQARWIPSEDRYNDQKAGFVPKGRNQNGVVTSLN